jgi:hypothetical protein
MSEPLKEPDRNDMHAMAKRHSEGAGGGNMWAYEAGWMGFQTDKRLESVLSRYQERRRQAFRDGGVQRRKGCRCLRGGERAGSAGCGRAKKARQVRAIGIAALLNLPAFLIRAAPHQGVHDMPHSSTRAMLR